MARKKQRNTQTSVQPAAAKSTKKPTTASSSAKPAVPHAAVVGMAVGGAFLGFLSGLNQWPAMAAKITGLAPGAAWFGWVLGSQNLDYNAAFQGGFLGLVIGLGFALSFAFSERKMLNTWLLAGCGMFVATMTLHHILAAAGGWILGWMLALSAPPRA